MSVFLRRTGLCVGLFAVLGLVIVAATGASEITIGSGAIKGELLDDGTRVYRGIPFASPPVGELRWQPPKAVASWDGVRPATEFGAICPQAPTMAAMTGGALPEMSEDCLFLNVWTPAADADAELPVMVWIHGGGLNFGWSSQPGYEGDEIAKRGVVLVSINYRLGPLGYVALPALSQEADNGVYGNYGFLDQLAALEWVRRNIGAFGGDPGSVTVFGESAGATSVFALLASPMSEGLVHRAIAESAWVTDTNMTGLRQAGTFVASAEALGSAWAAQVATDGDTSLAALRSIPAGELISRSGEAYQPVIAIDGWFMPENGEDTFRAGKQLDVPLIAGTNADEGTLFIMMGMYQGKAAMEGAVRATYGAHSDPLLALYPVATEADARAAANQMLTDTWFLRATRVLLNGMSHVSSAAYQYHFTRVSRSLPMLGAHHAAELGYVFNAFGGGLGSLPEDSLEEADHRLAAAMIGYWTQFAKTGDPNMEGLPEWPAYTPDSRSFLELGEKIEVGSALGEERLDELDRILAAAVVEATGGL